MRIHLSVFWLVSLLAILCYPEGDCQARIEKFEIHLQTGFFVPDNPGVIGSQSIDYYESNDFYILTSRGFGYGYDIIFAADCKISDWILRVDLGRRYLHNGPDKSEISKLDSYYENRMTIFPAMLNILREIEIEQSTIVSYAGGGIGVNVIDWNESRFSQASGYVKNDLTRGTKSSIAYNFIVGSKFKIYNQFSISLEYSYRFVPGRINIRSYYGGSGNSIVNVGGNAFRVGMVMGL